MGNETFRAARSSGFRRSGTMRTKSNGGHAYITEDEVDRQPTESLTPKANRRMDKLRRSLTFRRKKKPADAQKLDSTPPPPPSTTPASTAVKSAESGSARPALWLDDEKRVRAGTCSFQVKYLGYQEVSDSRGMHICENALTKLIEDKDKKKVTKAILYITGDSLRVVDESNKMLLVDQTIEKVSFCAPDRHHENGFAYICRDGAARRWLCHGFLAAKDTLKSASSSCTGGERLSHAVGCAFSICLERKQKRERENVTMEMGPNHSFTRLGSFRQASLTERFDDPQMVIPKVDPVPIKQVANPHAIERPKAASLSRQNSLRGQPAISMPFRRGQPAYQSLKPAELPSFQQQKLGFVDIPGSKTLGELAELAKIAEVPETAAELTEQFNHELSFSSPVQSAPLHSTSSVFATPITPSVQQPPPLPPLPHNIQYSSPMSFSSHSFTQTVVPSAYKSPMASASAETFEQKWARIQAAKNTNPFAEDIAKKYEIKL